MCTLYILQGCVTIYEHAGFHIARVYTIALVYAARETSCNTAYSSIFLDASCLAVSITALSSVSLI